MIKQLPLFSFLFFFSTTPNLFEVFPIKQPLVRYSKPSTNHQVSQDTSNLLILLVGDIKDRHFLAFHALHSHVA
uniref:Secreted protein n=1 Tax=Rhizophora mucronata TaxID=61149 RepID=A0A2P2KJL7_RHIMU